MGYHIPRDREYFRASSILGIMSGLGSCQGFQSRKSEYFSRNFILHFPKVNDKLMVYFSVHGEMVRSGKILCNIWIWRKMRDCYIFIEWKRYCQGIQRANIHVVSVSKQFFSTVSHCLKYWLFIKYILRTGVSSSIQGHAKFSGKPNEPKLSVVFPSVSLPFDAPYWVLDTDYHTYAVVWSCTNFGIFKSVKLCSNTKHQYLWSLVFQHEQMN